MPEPGDTLYGFCHGAFGRDSYGDKVVIAVGRDWVLVRERTYAVPGDGLVHVYQGDPADLEDYLIEEDEE